MSVEDEWERELESEEDLDLLFVTYDARRITVDAVLERIRELGFEVKVAE